MGENSYYFVQACIFILVALAFIFTPPKNILKRLNVNENKGLDLFIRAVVVIAASTNALLNYNKFLN